jgi:hypothetical protein
MLSMGTPMLVQEESGGKEKEEIAQGLVDWHKEDGSCGQYGKAAQIFRNGGAEGTSFQGFRGLGGSRRSPVVHDSSRYIRMKRCD